MQQIEIDSVIRQIAVEYEKEVRAKYLTSIKKGMKKLYDFLINSHYSNDCFLMSYVRTIVCLLEENKLLTLEPQYFETFERENFVKLSDCDLNTQIEIGKTKQSFHEWLTYYLHYSDIRRYVYPKYLEKLKINTCVYCNSEFISTSHLKKMDEHGNVIKDEHGEVVIDNKGRFQLDHYKPKSKHPFLSISFFNLQPSCNFCNLWKEDDDIPFNLYTNVSGSPSPFEFSVAEENIIDYVNRHQKDCLKLDFKSTIANYEKLHIKEVYESFNDEVEELLWKKVSNGVSYLDLLEKSLPKDLVVDPNILHRFFYGFYREPKDILKRPLTKMKQDIAIQLEKIAPKIKG